jgi:hypothetical protein
MAVNAAPRAAYMFHHMVPSGGSAAGHLVLLTRPSRVTDLTSAWWRYLLNGDSQARSWFVGANCTVCSHNLDFEGGQLGLL